MRGPPGRFEILTYRAFLVVLQTARWLGRRWRALYDLSWSVSPRVGSESLRWFDGGFYSAPEPEPPTLHQFLDWCDSADTEEQPRRSGGSGRPGSVG